MGKGIRKERKPMTPNHAIDSDNYSAPLRAPIIAPHRERYA